MTSQAPPGGRVVGWAVLSRLDRLLIGPSTVARLTGAGVDVFGVVVVVVVPPVLPCRWPR